MVEARGSNPLRSTPLRARGLGWIRHRPSIRGGYVLDRQALFVLRKPGIAGSNPAESVRFYFTLIHGLGFVFELSYRLVPS